MNSQQKKLAFLTAGILLILALSWFLAIRKTWINYSELKQATSEISTLGNPEKTISELTEQLREIKANQQIRDDSVHTQLAFKQLSDLSNEVKNVRIVQFPEIHRFQPDSYRVETMKLELEGSFQSLLSYLYLLEKETTTGKIVSANFRIIKDFKQNKESLRLTIFIQNFYKKTSGNDKQASL